MKNKERGSANYIRLLETDPQTKDIFKAGRVVQSAGLTGLAVIASFEMLVFLSPHPELIQYLLPLAAIIPAVLCIIRSINRYSLADKIMDAKMAAENVSAKSQNK